MLENIKNRNNSIIKKSSLDVVKRGIRHLDFKELNKTDIIEQDSISCIVDTNVPKNEFSEKELKFIQQKCQTCSNVSGKDVWEKYNDFINNFQIGYADKKINTSIWSSILSKFMINIRNSYDSERLSEIIGSIKEYPLLKNEFYSKDMGIDRTLLKKNSFLVNNN